MINEIAKAAIAAKNAADKYRGGRSLMIIGFGSSLVVWREGITAWAKAMLPAKPSTEPSNTQKGNSRPLMLAQSDDVMKLGISPM